MKIEKCKHEFTKVIITVENEYDLDAMKDIVIAYKKYKGIKLCSGDELANSIGIALSNAD